MADPKTPEQPRRSARGTVRRADDDADVRGAALDLRAGLVQMRDNAQETLANCRREQIAMQEARAAFNARGVARGGPVNRSGQRDGEIVAPSLDTAIKRLEKVAQFNEVAEDPVGQMRKVIPVSEEVEAAVHALTAGSYRERDTSG
ncbi:hypothetical protein PRZ48_005491 [Zasmidium cellare]|uniref:Uncharacterized protein n=1 Tax=Zasmidium cellare TaxID=395010 RepID=A0ABR0ESX7_ZASCE|nr:hypothetical protein PRZ48_005491 [Zasmidium cellare]